MTAYREHIKAEGILGVGCPVCGAEPGAWCDRAGEKLSRQGKLLRAAGTPPSHQQRMWLRHGHPEDEFPALLARQRRFDEDNPAQAPLPGLASPACPALPAGVGGVLWCEVHHRHEEIRPQDGPRRRSRSPDGRKPCDRERQLREALKLCLRVPGKGRACICEEREQNRPGAISCPLICENENDREGLAHAIR